MNFDLIIFDVDGTLAEKYTLNLLPGVTEFFRLVNDPQCRSKPRLALATNQGGVGMRWWMQKIQSKDYQKFPTEAEIEQRMQSLIGLLGGIIPWYVAYRYRNRGGRWTPPPPGVENDPRWSEDWRKPNPGMLREAMHVAGVTQDRTLFVGDSPDDQAAALAAGCAFEWANAFFSYHWHGCEALDNWKHYESAED